MNIPGKLFYIPEFGTFPARVLESRYHAIEAAIDEEIDGKTPIVICYSLSQAVALNKLNKEVKDETER